MRILFLLVSVCFGLFAQDKVTEAIIVSRPIQKGKLQAQTSF